MEPLATMKKPYLALGSRRSKKSQRGSHPEERGPATHLKSDHRPMFLPRWAPASSPTGIAFAKIIVVDRHRDKYRSVSRPVRKPTPAAIKDGLARKRQRVTGGVRAFSIVFASALGKTGVMSNDIDERTAVYPGASWRNATGTIARQRMRRWARARREPGRGAIHSKSTGFPQASRPGIRAGRIGNTCSVLSPLACAGFDHILALWTLSKNAFGR